MKNTRKGFTLVELLVVIAILAILATVSVVGYTSFINRANDSVAQQELTQIRDYYIASKYIKEVAVDDNLVRELGLQGNILRGKVGEDVIYKYTVKTGVAYWNTTTNSISSTKLDAWEEVLCDHVWADATCTLAQTCTLCGDKKGEALGHKDVDPADHTCDVCSAPNISECTGGTATCTEKAECSICGEEYGSTLEHSFSEEWLHNTNGHYHKCNNCEATTGMTGHNYKNGACTVCEKEDPNMVTVYLVPSAGWKRESARFAVYMWLGETNYWVDMTLVSDGVYQAKIPSEYKDIKFVRMNPNQTANNWDNKWNETGDLKVPTDGKCYYATATATWYQNTTSIPEIMYLDPGAWRGDDIWFQAWTWGGSKADSWITFTDNDGDGILEAEIEEGRTGIKFLRKGSSHAANQWQSHNDSGDQTIKGNYFVVNGYGNYSWFTK